MTHLTNPSNVKRNVRPVSKHLDDDRISIFIDEAEQLNIKPRIGDALFIDLLKWADSADKAAFPEAYETLMCGGEYLSKTSCANAVQRTFKGLALTLEYYVYAKLVKNNDTNVTRFSGDAQKRDDYSFHADLKAKLVAENDALTVADGYMADCIDFLMSQDTIPLFVTPGRAKSRLRISIIGD